MLRDTPIKLITMILLGVLCVFHLDPAFAQPSFNHVVDNNVLDGIVKLYRDTAMTWRETIFQAATHLFWLLVGIDFIWTGISLALQRADFSQIVAEIIRRIMMIGFYYAILVNSGHWTQTVIDSFRILAGEAGRSSGLSGGISPSNIFDIGLRIVGDLTDKVSFAEIGESLARIIVSLAILFSFALIAAFLLVALIETYIAINATVILLGLGGSRWTSDYAIKYLLYVFSAGMKIFVMQLLIGIGQSFIQTMNTAYSGNMTQSLILFGVSIVLCVLVKTIPDYVQGILNGVAPQSAGNALLGTSAAAASSAIGATVGGALGGIGATMAVIEGTKLAKAHGAPSTTGLVLGAAKHLGQSVLGDLGGRLSGNIAHQHGTMGARMASKMKEQRLSMPPPKPTSEEADGIQNI